MARKLKKYQGTENSEVKANPYGVAKNRDAANNDLIAYFNSLSNRSDPGMMGDVVPVQPKVVKEPTGNTTILTEPLWPAPPRFKDGGSWERLGKSKFKKPKYKKDKKTKPNRKGLY